MFGFDSNGSDPTMIIMMLAAPLSSSSRVRVLVHEKYHTIKKKIQEDA
jgi:hypothetical protein